MNMQRDKWERLRTVPFYSKLQNYQDFMIIDHSQMFSNELEIRKFRCIKSHSSEKYKATNQMSLYPLPVFRLLVTDIWGLSL